MKRVTGIGGVFFKAKDPKALGEWYKTHLGMNVEAWGGVAFRWSDDNPGAKGTTIWNPFKEDTSYFAPSTASFMINYRVEDLHALLAKLREEGCSVEKRSKTPSTANSAGYKTPKATSWNYGNRRMGNELQYCP